MALCELAQMTPQNYYARRSVRSRQEVDLGLVLALVKAERKEQPRLGVRKLYHLIAPELKAAGVKLGRDRLFEELGKVELLVAPKPSEWPKTTQVDPNLPVFKNLSKRFKATGPNQVWVADITYIRTREDFMYLGLITDRWSRKIVGYHLGESLETEHVLKALAMALKGLQGSGAADPPLRSGMPVCVPCLCWSRAEGGSGDEHDREEPQCGERFGRASQRDLETGILAGCEF